MAGIDVGGRKGGRKRLDSEINMIPMIDLLMVTISFLLLTAVWVQNSRLTANAQVPGPSSLPPCEGGECKEEARLHVEAKDHETFLLTWRRGRDVVRTLDVPREHGPRFGALASAVQAEWKAVGEHKAPEDRGRDRAVVHAPNDLPYKELIAMMDAVSAPRRTVAFGGATAVAPAFDVTFAAD